MPNPDHNSRVQHQFGRSAADYATSDVHASGESLQLLLELSNPEDHWVVLDVATGAGHTAIAFAPYVSRIVATDITEEMLQTTLKLARQRGVNNLEVTVADAVALPFDDHTFDMVTCRLAFHHFVDQQQALCEFARVLKTGGTVGFTDNYTVHDPADAEFYNQYERLRDPSHHCVNSLAQLESLFQNAGLTAKTIKRLSKRFEFHQWADRQRVSDIDKKRLLDMLDHVPEGLQPLLQPEKDKTGVYFNLAEVVIVAERVEIPK